MKSTNIANYFQTKYMYIFLTQVMRLDIRYSESLLKKNPLKKEKYK